MEKKQDITLIDIPPQNVLGIRKKGHYRDIAVLLPKLCEYMFSKGIGIAGMPMFLCHETGKEEAIAADAAGNADIEVAVPVIGNPEGNGEIRHYTIPGGKMARTFHRGPYEACEPTYLALFTWICEHNLQISGPIRELYHNDPNEVKPEEILTEILAPVE
jgi:effector-binding domain-containing protein